jgi:asparagine synthase (glutamine-hydrolysing)
MNRIAGILNFDHTPVDSSEINRMTHALKRRNHDAQSVWVSEEVGLSCTHIVGLAAEPTDRLLSLSPNEGCLITFDGRIDNRRELIAALNSQLANQPLPISDEEIVLAAYKTWGPKCPSHLIGDFAFAIWDKRKHWLVCARDHFGVKPFYYALTKEAFVFASTPTAILASEKVPPTIHEERIADFLINPLEGIDKTSSFYKDVFRLPPAHLLMVQADWMKIERYWELCPELHPEWKTDDELIEAFQELFSESVRCRLYNARVSASMLSGGMDSSSIVGVGRSILAKQGNDPLQTFAVISNHLSTNRETNSISSVLKQGNLQSHLISETELSRWMDKLVKAIEAEIEPFDCLMNLNRSVYLYAEERGLQAVLDGIDGDVLLSGSGRLTQLWREGLYRTIFEETLRADGLTAE